MGARGGKEVGLAMTEIRSSRDRASLVIGSVPFSSAGQSQGEQIRDEEIKRKGMSASRPQGASRFSAFETLQRSFPQVPLLICTCYRHPNIVAKTLRSICFHAQRIEAGYRH